MEEMNREYKDRLFKFIFGNPENKAWTLSLYNAVNGSDYQDPQEIQLTTIEDAVYMNMKNDVSFLIANVMSLYEQQSTFNPNMPMRFLIYAGMVYSRYIEMNSSYHRYSARQQKAPTPKCVCFYNGTAEAEDRVNLSLRDAFDAAAEADIEVRVTMLNINYGRNRALMEACRPLRDYSWFVDEVRQNQKRYRNLELAVEAAIMEMPEDSVIKPYLLANKAEVKRMCITEYDEARTFAEQREEGRAEGREEGRAEGRAEGREEGRLELLVTLVKNGLLTLKDAAGQAGMSEAAFQQKL